MLCVDMYGPLASKAARNTHAVAIPEHSHLSLLTPRVAAENAPRGQYSALPPSCTFQDEAVQVQGVSHKHGEVDCAVCVPSGPPNAW